MSFNPSYVGRREDVERMIPDSARRVLDFGCSTGALGRNLKEARPGIEVHGVELDPSMAKEARRHLDAVYEGDLNALDLSRDVAPASFDTLVFADVLEHLVDPWSVLRKSIELLEPGGHAVICLPNVRHYTTLFDVAVLGRWPYRDRGIHDRTHLRWFTLKNARELVAQAGLELVRVERNYRIIERPTKLNVVSLAFAWPGLKDLLAFQYLLLARKP